MRLLRTSLIAFVALLSTLSPAAAFDVPVNDGFYTQTTNLLTTQQEGALEQLLDAFEQSTSNEVAVLVVETLQGEPPEDVANAVFRSWGLGKSDKNNGLLILVASADHVIRMEVGLGLEGAVPDIAVKGIVDADMSPLFREGKYFEGLRAGVDALQKHIGGEYTAERYRSEESEGFLPFVFFFLFVVLNFFGALMARTTSWWLGGVLGGVMGIILTAAFGWWLSIPFFALMGLFFDYVLSKNPHAGRRRGRGYWGGGGFGGGMGGGGGFGGFGGGTSGGGGATGKW